MQFEVTGIFFVLSQLKLSGRALIYTRRTVVKRNILTGMIILFIVAAGIRAGVVEPPVLQTVRALYGGTHPLDVTFTLHIVWKVREKEETQNGRFILAPGDKFRCEIGKNLWICDGTTLWQINTADKSPQVTVRNLEDEDVAMYPSHIVSTYLNSREFRTMNETATQIVIESTPGSIPKNDDTRFVRLIIDKKNGIILSLFIIDRNGNESTYRFKKTKTDIVLNPKLFTYSTAKGVTVVDMR